MAEHIAEAQVGYYLDTLANGRVVAMTHALPGQGGHHHVNCQPPEYWIEKMVAKGFVLSEDNDILRTISNKDFTWSYFSKSGLVFLKS